MKKNETIIYRVGSDFASLDCVQIFVPCKNEINIFDSNGIIYGDYAEKQINKYLEDSRKNQFPYSNIPIHYEKDGVNGKICYINTIISYEKSYVIVGDEYVSYLYALRDGSEALVINDYYYNFDTKDKNFNRSELDDLLNINENDEIYYVTSDEKVFDSFIIPSDDELFDKYKENLTPYFENVMRPLPDFLSSFLECSIRNLSLNELDYDISGSLFSNKDKLVIIKPQRRDIEVIVLKNIVLKRLNSYIVKIFDLPTKKYTLEELKYASKIKKMNDVNIPLNLNPSLSKTDIEEAKRLIRKKY